MEVRQEGGKRSDELVEYFVKVPGRVEAGLALGLRQLLLAGRTWLGKKH